MSGEQKGVLGAPQRFNTSLCEREPIHVPGAIQPHGALLAVLADGLSITHASANLAEILGYSAEAVLGRPLEEVLGPAACRVLLGAGLHEGTAPGQEYFLPGPDGRTCHLQAHRSGRSICVDIEPMRSEPWQRLPVTIAQSVLKTFKQATTRTELCELAVRGMKTIAGYDRVMAYRFGEDGHGEVVAEACEPTLEPYIGLRYPATDVPPQARRLYLRQSVGAIANSSYRPVPLLVDPKVDDGTPLDLTQSVLRSVSPIHCQYMRNMGTAASLTIGLAQGPNLWGMLVCHHATPRVAGPELRAVADMIGQVVSLLLSSLGDAELYSERLKRLATIRALIDCLSAPLPLPAALAAATVDLLGLVDAAGAVVRLSGTPFCLGRTPPLAMANGALDLLLARAGSDVLALDNLGLRYPELAACISEGSGALLLPLTPDTDDAILWFRPELVNTVTWGGNPAEHATSDPVSGQLSPRASFAAWRETVSGRSAPWTEVDLAMAGELRGAVAAELAQRTKAELARLRHYDSLTGLPNRSMLLDRLADTQHAMGEDTSLLFLDLDRFKAVNDTMGHAAGDALLVEVAQRLLVAAGSGPLVVRLGGDEFVVLCRGLDQEAVAALGERIRQSIAAPFEIAGRSCHVSASIGIAVAGQSDDIDLIQAADMAMYAAKQHGGNRGMLFERSLYDRAAGEFDLDLDLRAAISSEDQLTLVYQPLFEIASGAKCLLGFEALLRWRHPLHGRISPKIFIPLAEKSGLIHPLGEWVLAKAVRQGRVLQQARPDVPLCLMVNVSASQLAVAGFCSNLVEVLRTEGFSPDSLCLEVTESILADAAVTQVLGEVRMLGMRVAIDDFGMGYSSLSYLRRLPVDVVKLDRSFLDDVNDNVCGADYIAALIALAHAARMKVVVEGIETQTQFDVTWTAGADVVQGLFVAPPLSAEAATQFAARPEPLFRTAGHAVSTPSRILAI